MENTIPYPKNRVIDLGLGDGGKVEGYIKTSEEQEMNSDGTYNRSVNITEEFIIK